MRETVTFGDVDVEYTNPCNITILKNSDGYVMIYNNEKIGVVGEKDGILGDLSRHLEYIERKED